MTWFRTVHYKKAVLKGKNPGMTSGGFEIFTPLRYTILRPLSALLKHYHRNQIKFSLRMFRTFIQLLGGSLFKIL